MTEKLPSYGGQALIEGVLMRGSKGLAAAMRKPDGQIVIEIGAIPRYLYQSIGQKRHLFAELLLLWDSLGIGMHFLTVSANMQTGEDEKLEGPALYLTLAVSLAFGVGLFFLLPAGIGHLAINFLNFSTWWSNVLEGVARLVIAIRVYLGYRQDAGYCPGICLSWSRT